MLERRCAGRSSVAVTRALDSNSLPWVENTQYRMQSTERKDSNTEYKESNIE